MSIRSFRENELEDFLAVHPGSFLEDDSAVVIGRQVALPHGRLDLLIFVDTLYIIELKARPLIPKDVAQVLRYQLDIRDLLWNASHQLECVSRRSGYRGYAGAEFRKEYKRMTLGTPDTFLEPATVPVLIAPSWDESVVAALTSVGGRIFDCERIEPGAFAFTETYGAISVFDPQYWPRNLDWLNRYLEIVDSQARTAASIEEDLLAWRLFGDLTGDA